MRRFPSGVSDQYIYFVAVDATDYVTRETGLSSFTVRRSRNGGASAAYTTPTINETDSSNMPGVYELLLDEDMTIDSGDDSQEVCLHITHAGMAPVTLVYELYRPKITAGETLTVSSGNGNAAVQTVATGAITAGAIAADAIGASELAADAVAEIADAVWDEAQSGHTTAGTFGRFLDAQVANVETDTQDIQSRLPAALVSGRMDASVGAMAADVLTSTALAASAVAEIQAGLSTHSAADVWSVATRVLTAGTNISLAKGTGITGFNDLSAAQVNAEVDTAIADAALATAANLATVDTVVDAVKAKTDSLTFTVAGQVDANIVSVNEVTVNGAGTAGNPWGP